MPKKQSWQSIPELVELIKKEIKAGQEAGLKKMASCRAAAASGCDWMKTNNFGSDKYYLPTEATVYQALQKKPVYKKNAPQKDSNKPKVAYWAETDWAVEKLEFIWKDHTDEKLAYIITRELRARNDTDTYATKEQVASFRKAQGWHKPRKKPSATMRAAHQASIGMPTSGAKEAQTADASLRIIKGPHSFFALMELPANGCREIVGVNEQGEALYCGAKRAFVAGKQKPYCTKHLQGKYKPQK